MQVEGEEVLTDDVPDPVRVLGTYGVGPLALDEAVALAAGHRPCFRCRREAAEAFRAAWMAAVGKEASSAAAMDMVLHR
jgi:hypothetical protein